jgi:hypothetical protein
MRRVSLLLVAALLACQSDFVTSPAPVQWLEWPQEVVAGHVFDVRVVVPPICAQHATLTDDPQLSDTAITFAPTWRYEQNPDIVCAATAAAPANAPADLANGYSTTVSLPGLPLPTQGHYALITVGPNPADGPLATHVGDLVVHADSADTSRTGAAGFVAADRTAGCTRIVQPGVGGYVIENPADTTSFWTGFVSGYLYRPDTLVCGAARVFHLVRTS